VEADQLRVLGYGRFRGSPDLRVEIIDWVKWIGKWSAYTMPFEPTHFAPLLTPPSAEGGASDAGEDGR
jgi:hypothetical protein